MSFQIPAALTIVTEQRRTVEFSFNAHGRLGDEFVSVIFTRESVFLDTEGNVVKRVTDPMPFEFSPETISQTPDLKAAIATIHKYLDGADMQRRSQ